jgi:hypothetical protein
VLRKSEKNHSRREIFFATGFAKRLDFNICIVVRCVVAFFSKVGIVLGLPKRCACFTSRAQVLGGNLE